MNRIINNNIYRIQNELLVLNGEGFSIKRLAKLIGISESIIRDDISYIKKTPQILLDMRLPNNYPNEEADYTCEKQIDSILNDDSFDTKLKNGDYDDYIFFISSDDDMKEIMIESDELDILNDFMNEGEKGQKFFIKNSNVLRDDDQIYNVNYLLETIKAGDSIDLVYKGRKKTIRPIKIIHNINDDLLYVFDHKGKSYNIEGIDFSKIRESGTHQMIGKNIDKTLFDKMWGVNYSTKYINVKVKIFNEGNVIERVKNDLGRKLETCKFLFEDGDEFAIYEDKVIGLECFLTWVYSYGSSMIILEPKELVDKVVKSLKDRKLMYESEK